MSWMLRWLGWVLFVAVLGVVGVQHWQLETKRTELEQLREQRVVDLGMLRASVRVCETLSRLNQQYSDRLAWVIEWLGLEHTPPLPIYPTAMGGP